MKNLKTVVLSLAIIMLSVSMGFSQRGVQGQMNCNEPMIFNVIPNLTQDQKDKIENDRLEMTKKITPLQAELKVKKAELNVLMTKNSTIKQKEVIVKEMSDIQFKIKMERISHHDNVRALLTDNQKVAFDNMTLKHHGMKKGMHKNHHKPGMKGGNRNGMNGNGPHNGNGNGPRNGTGIR